MCSRVGRREAGGRRGEGSSTCNVSWIGAMAFIWLDRVSMLLDRSLMETGCRFPGCASGLKCRL